MKDDMLIGLASSLNDPVTTTDELIPSGETSAYRSNPERLSEFALSRRDPAYVGRANAIKALDADRAEGKYDDVVIEAMKLCGESAETLKTTLIGSAIFAEKPGDGSAREQAASCQRVLGGSANICREFATKRYRSNCINWGMLPFTIAPETPFDYKCDDFIFIPGIRAAVESGADKVNAKVISGGKVTDIELLLPGFTAEEREIVLAGCLMNWYAKRKG